MLPTTKTPVATLSPGLLTLYGPSKVGKTTMLSQLEGCLIADTEEGTKYVESYNVKIKNIVDFHNFLNAIKQPHQFKYGALDTIDNVAIWYEQLACKEYKVKTIGDIPYGGGYNVVREKVMKAVQHMKSCFQHLIVVGHLKKTLIGTDTVEVDTSSLDLTGKLKNLIMADSDAVGIVYREEDQLMISFKGSAALEVGSRCDHLKGQVLPFEWKNIYV